MDRSEKEIELVLHTLEELDYSIGRTENPYQYWIYYSYKRLKYKIAVFVDRIDEEILYFTCELPFHSILPLESLLIFYNKINVRINFGKFFFNDEMKTHEFQHGLIYRPDTLTPQLIKDALFLVVQTPINYEYALSVVLKKESISPSEMNKILDNKQTAQEKKYLEINHHIEKATNNINQNSQTKDNKTFKDEVSNTNNSKADIVESKGNDENIVGNYLLIFQNPGTNKKEILKRFHKIFNLHFYETRKIRESCPYVLKENLTFEQATKYKKMFEDIDAVFEVVEQ